ncbi:MAG: type II and III secretion system protein family protein [Deltaproteobacteria bacterium]|jgi:pilus assembly protein CpaC|nr:type II and III secretion system protein family protein [Deltaproteobacteria bacterium]
MFLSKEFAKRNSVSIIMYVLSLVLLGLVFSAISRAADSVLPEIEKPKKLQVVVGKSIILKSPTPVKRVSIADPEIAAFILLSPKEIYITGKASGITNLTLWQNKKISVIYDLEVDYDISRLKQKFHEVLPLEKEIRVIATHDSITLSGTISSAANLSQAMALAEAYAPKGNVRNLLEVGGVHQVMLEVRMAEMSKSVIKNLGINFSYIRGGDLGLSLLGGLTQLDELTDTTLSLLVSPAVNTIFSFNKGNANWTGFVEALKENGLVKILAEPTLIALSGQTANFLAGGEFPIPVPQGLGTVAIEYKSFGVGLSFTPTVLSEDKISIKVAPEVSELDFSAALSIGGFVVPGLSTRKASTVVELADGQSFAIAGLLKETVRDSMSKFPLLGDIPILGALFRSRAFQKNETELIIIVTPHLVKPLDPARQTLPTDFYIEPDDTEIYLLGLMEGWEKNQPSTVRGELDGEFGHGVPYPD